MKNTLANHVIAGLVSRNQVQHVHYFDEYISLSGCLGFAGNDAPSFVFPTAIATKSGVGSTGGSGGGRPSVASKPSYLTGGSGAGSNLAGKRGTEDLDFFIGDEALAACNGPGTVLNFFSFED